MFQEVATFRVLRAISLYRTMRFTSAICATMLIFSLSAQSSRTRSARSKRVYQGRNLIELTLYDANGRECFNRYTDQDTSIQLFVFDSVGREVKLIHVRGDQECTCRVHEYEPGIKRTFTYPPVRSAGDLRSGSLFKRELAQLQHPEAVEQLPCVAATLQATPYLSNIAYNDTLGRVTKESSFGPKGEKGYVRTHTFGVHAHALHSHREERFRRYHSAVVDSATMDEHYTLDSSGNPVHWFRVDRRHGTIDTAITYNAKYTSQGRCSKEWAYGPNMAWSKTHTYDRNGQLIKTVSYNAEMLPVRISKYKWNRKGLMTKERHIDRGMDQPKTVFTLKRKYTFWPRRAVETHLRSCAELPDR